MNEQLRIRVGEYLLSRGIKFNQVDSVDLDPDGPTLDIWFEGTDGRAEYLELSDVKGFLTFLVTGGK